VSDLNDWLIPYSSFGEGSNFSERPESSKMARLLRQDAVVEKYVEGMQEMMVAVVAVEETVVQEVYTDVMYVVEKRPIKENVTPREF
jgi:phosphoribosyl-ATP pyrophosphohydrolase